jgi:hypothetical protein
VKDAVVEGMGAEMGGQALNEFVFTPLMRAVLGRGAGTAGAAADGAASAAAGTAASRPMRLLGPDELAEVRAGASRGWSSKSLRNAADALENGATSVTHHSREEAEELFLGRYASEGFRNTTGMAPTAAKAFFGTKEGTYHWDIGEAAYPHGDNHLQVHTFAGAVIRIFFP